MLSQKTLNYNWSKVWRASAPGLNTQNMRNSNLVYVSKMEYVHKVNIFGLKMMVKSGLEKIILKFLHAEAIFY
jgi:hypothetical protein